MPKIDLNDTLMDVVVKMSAGNPGAVSVVSEIIRRAKEIDPQDALAPLGPILSLDEMEIYGSSIYVLCRDKCDGDVRKLLVLLRANQLGFLSRKRVTELATDQTRSVNLNPSEFEELDRKVCDRLSEFERPPVALTADATGGEGTVSTLNSGRSSSIYPPARFWTGPQT